ncbi:SDR family oxidoreductase [Roseateles sp. BYS96W]|uniref:SDR family oxidoreductase n=1 Tax=Pelomonas nitida TaxID=3299027 RepID=A0ABW7GCI5_9BURK
MSSRNSADVQALTVLVVGATGSVGRLVVAEALARGHRVRALVRNVTRAAFLPAKAQRVVGDPTDEATLAGAVSGIDAVVFTHGSSTGRRVDAERVDYGAVRNVLRALDGRAVRVALMTAIGVTNLLGEYNRRTGAHDWKRRSERLLRASGLAYTIVRPGWFDYNAPDQLALRLLQGDRRQAGDPSDGVVARRQIAEVLVASLSSEAARGKTFELIAERGPAPQRLESLFDGLDVDLPAALDGVYDSTNMPLHCEPENVRDDLRQLAPAGLLLTERR